MKKNILAFVVLASFSLFGYAQETQPQPKPQPQPQPQQVDTVAAQSEQPAQPAQSVDMPAQLQRVSLGLRGGMAMTVGSKDIFKHVPGGNIALDVQYAKYWLSNHTHVGLLVGASLDYMATGAGMVAVVDNYQAATDNGNINYTILASEVVEVQRQLMVEVPLMFSLVDRSGVFFNVGPRFAFPVWTSSMVSFDGSSVLAFFPEEGVLVPNEKITGRSGSQQTPTKAEWNAPYMRILMGAELGYEFRFKCGGSLGLGVYADCELASLQKPVTSSPSFLRITEPSAKAPATLVVQSPLDQYAKTLGLFDVGLKLTYHFNMVK